MRSTHHRNSAIRPSPQETRLICTPCHAVVSRSERAANKHGYFRDRRRCDSRNKLCAVPRDAFVLILTPHHESCDILQEHKWNFALRAELNKVCALLRRLRKQHAVVCDYPDGAPFEVRETGDQSLTVARFELIKPRAIHDTRDHFANIVRRAQISRNDTKKFAWIIGGLFACLPRHRAWLPAI